jgi:hypothetical protein
MTEGEFAQYRTAGVSVGKGSYPITPSDSVDIQIAGVTEGIASLYVSVAGDVKFTAIDGSVDTWAVTDNQIIPVAMKRVWSTGTTATGLKGIR